MDRAWKNDREEEKQLFLHALLEAWRVYAANASRPLWVTGRVHAPICLLILLEKGDGQMKASGGPRRGYSFLRGEAFGLSAGEEDHLVFFGEIPEGDRAADEEVAADEEMESAKNFSDAFPGSRGRGERGGGSAEKNPKTERSGRERKDKKWEQRRKGDREKKGGVFW